MGSPGVRLEPVDGSSVLIVILRNRLLRGTSGTLASWGGASPTPAAPDRPDSRRLSAGVADGDVAVVGAGRDPAVAVGIGADRRGDRAVVGLGDEGVADVVARQAHQQVAVVGVGEDVERRVGEVERDVTVVGLAVDGRRREVAGDHVAVVGREAAPRRRGPRPGCRRCRWSPGPSRRSGGPARRRCPSRRRRPSSQGAWHLDADVAADREEERAVGADLEAVTLDPLGVPTVPAARRSGGCAPRCPVPGSTVADDQHLDPSRRRRPRS